MIGKLTGRIDSIKGHHLILDVNGVGYVVACSARTLRDVGESTGPVALQIETHVREDAISLYGFATEDEQNCFRLLTTVQGVGAKVAQAILGSVSTEQLAQNIAAQDKTAWTRADGVGPKLALRIVTELKDKFPSFAATISPASNKSAGFTLPPSATGDAVSALINLGYSRAEAFAAVAQVSRANPEARLNDLIRLSLAELGRQDKVA